MIITYIVKIVILCFSVYGMGVAIHDLLEENEDEPNE